MKRAVQKIENFLNKYQMFILGIELLGVMLITAYICRNIALDWDEAYSFQMVTKYSLGEMVQKTAADIHPPLYYLILRLFSSIFGRDFFVMKLVSVLFTGLTMALGIIFVRKNWGWKIALIFNLIVGLGPQFIYFSVNIRMYSMALFFVTCSAFLAYEILQGKQGKMCLLYWVLFVLSSLGGAYTHYFAVIPLALIYGYLLVGLFLFERKKCKYFFLSCLFTVLGYLPWLSVVVQSFQRFGVKKQVDLQALDFSGLWKWLSKTNIKWSEYMPLVLFVFSILLFVITWKKYTSREKLFLGMCALNFVLSYAVSRLIASLNGHFWDNRYVFPALALWWLFVCVMLIRQGNVVFCAYGVWAFIMVASSFTIQKSMELGTVGYMQETYKLLEPVRQEKTVIYDYNTFDVLYGAHLPNQELVFYDDVDFDVLDKEYVYFIRWGGNWFSDETIEKYHITSEECGTMRFELGVDGVKLYKIYFKKTGE